jgi:hypothetical protein
METYDLPGGGLLGRAATGERKGLRLPSLFASDLLLEELPLRDLRGRRGGTLQASHSCGLKLLPLIGQPGREFAHARSRQVDQQLCVR